MNISKGNHDITVTVKGSDRGNNHVWIRYQHSINISERCTLEEFYDKVLTDINSDEHVTSYARNLEIIGVSWRKQ